MYYKMLIQFMNRIDCLYMVLSEDLLSSWWQPLLIRVNKSPNINRKSYVDSFSFVIQITITMTMENIFLCFKHYFTNFYYNSFRIWSRTVFLSPCLVIFSIDFVGSAHCFSVFPVVIPSCYLKERLWSNWCWKHWSWSFCIKSNGD